MDTTSLILFQLLNGLVWGLIFALIALGLNLIYGLLGVINLAHGSLFMLGGVIGWYVVVSTGRFWLALLLAPLAVAALSVIIERTVLRAIAGKAVAAGIIATAGILLILDHAVLATFGGMPQSVLTPIGGSVQIGATGYPVYRLVVAASSLAAMLVLWLVLYRTNYGLWIRTVPQNPELARAVGIPVSRATAVTVALGGFFAALAGVLVAPIVSVHFQMGLAVLAPAFIVVVVGGLGSLRGAIVAAVIVGVVRGLLSVVLEPTVAEILSLVALAPILIVRPNGLFGT
jgi:branched-chain amino acid transport system permease protein